MNDNKKSFLSTLTFKLSANTLKVDKVLLAVSEKLRTWNTR